MAPNKNMDHNPIKPLKMKVRWLMWVPMVSRMLMNVVGCRPLNTFWWLKGIVDGRTVGAPLFWMDKNMVCGVNIDRSYQPPGYHFITFTQPNRRPKTVWESSFATESQVWFSQNDLYCRYLGPLDDLCFGLNFGLVVEDWPAISLGLEVDWWDQTVPSLNPPPLLKYRIFLFLPCC